MRESYPATPLTLNREAVPIADAPAVDPEPRRPAPAPTRGSGQDHHR
ncbi:MAG: hypothetical protein KTV68_02950 [Acidimicrobiia bacterium]|nr:hypothetical protein [Acidimicrobiia bacterium]MCY4434549.1 hypothetical protein [bacterium]